MKGRNAGKGCILLLILLMALLESSHAASVEHLPEDEGTPLDSYVENAQSLVVVSTTKKDAYPTIKAALDAAPDGAIISLDEGTYREILDITTSVTIQGKDPVTTIISVCSSPNSYAMRIKAPQVTIQSLSFINTGDGLYTTGIKVSGPSITIKDCIFSDTPIGIALWTSSNTIEGCTFQRCEDEGIAFLGSASRSCTDNIVRDCVFHKNGDGIELQYASDNVITGCEFVANTHAGIDAIGDDNTNNRITYCRFSQNEGYGLYLYGADETQIDHCDLPEEQVMVVHSQEAVISYSEVNSLDIREGATVSIEECSSLAETQIKAVSSEYSIVCETTPTEQAPTPSQHLREEIVTKIQYLYELICSFFEQLQNYGK